MARIEISSTDFRGKMGAMFDRADRGEQIIIRRKDKTSYTLTPVYEEDDEDEELTASQIEFIDRALEGIKNGEGIEYNSEEFKKRYGL